MTRRYIVLTVCWLLSLFVVYTYAQKKATTAAQNSAKILLENDRVRVREVIFQPGVKPGMHTHEYAHVGVIIEGGKLQFNEPGGKTETLDLPAGGAGFREKGITHEAVNLGKQPVRVVEVELKK